MRPFDFVVGLDLGKEVDPSALVIVDIRPPVTAPVYLVNHIERYPLGTPYARRLGDERPSILRHVEGVTRRFPLMLDGEPRCLLVPDQTGVGIAVMDIFRSSDRLVCPMLPITITATGKPHPDAGSWHVPKRDLAMVVQKLLQAERLKVNRQLTMTDQLIKELRDFRIKFSASGHDSYDGGARTDGHSDILLATACAVWVAEMRLRGAETPRVSFTYGGGRA